MAAPAAHPPLLVPLPASAKVAKVFGAFVEMRGPFFVSGGYFFLSVAAGENALKIYSEDSELKRHSAIDAEKIKTLKCPEAGGNAGILRSLVRIFFQDGDMRLQQIRIGLMENSLEMVRMHAHCLAEGAAELGMLRVQELAADLELWSTASIRMDPEMVFVSLEDEYSLAKVEIENVLKEQK